MCEYTMSNASEYRAMAAEHHRLAGMCRSPDPANNTTAWKKNSWLWQILRNACSGHTPRNLRDSCRSTNRLVAPQRALQRTKRRGTQPCYRRRRRRPPAKQPSGGIKPAFEIKDWSRDILAEAERPAQDIVASAVKIKAEADRALDEARSKAVCIQKRAQAALALAENIAKIFTCGPVHNGHSTGLRYLLRNVRLCCRGLPH